MANTPRIAVVGSANTDLITFADAFPRPGETIFGTVSISASAAREPIRRAARLCGGEVLMVAKVERPVRRGDGQELRRVWNRYHTRADHRGAPTGVAPIFVEPSGQNRIIVVKGANDQLTRRR